MGFQASPNIAHIDTMLITHTGVDGGAPQAGLEGPEHGGDAVHLPVRQHAGRGGHRRANLQKYLTFAENI